MTISGEMHIVKLESIQILRDQRQRRVIETDDLESSIRKWGILNPLIVRREGLVLVAGERRLEAARKLALAHVPVRFVEDLNARELEMLELEENIKRKDLTWQDHARGIERIHEMFCAEEPHWGVEETATQIGYHETKIRRAIIVVMAAREDPTLFECATLDEARNKADRLKRRAQAQALEEILREAVQGPQVQAPQGPASTPAGACAEAPTLAPAPGTPMVRLTPFVKPREPETILCEDFTKWASSYDGPKFNLVHLDFPYGVNAFGGGMIARGGQRSAHSKYEDDGASFVRLVQTLGEHIDRLASVSCHVMFWFGMQKYRETWELLAKNLPQFEFSSIPLIWHKSNNDGMVPSAQYWPRHVYETAFLGMRGKRPVVQVVSDFYGAPTDKSIHVSAKPVPVLEHFFRMLVDQHSEVLDPTCGSGNALRAAERLGAKRVLGVEIDPELADAARVQLRKDRMLRNASASLQGVR